jgi:hypothetical protein
MGREMAEQGRPDKDASDNFTDNARLPQALEDVSKKMSGSEDEQEN